MADLISILQELKGIGAVGKDSVKKKEIVKFEEDHRFVDLLKSVRDGIKTIKSGLDVIDQGVSFYLSGENALVAPIVISPNFVSIGEMHIEDDNENLPFVGEDRAESL